MLRLVLFFSVIMGIASGFSWMLAHDGNVIVQWGEYNVETSPAFLLLMLGVLGICISILTLGVQLLWRAPYRVRQYYCFKHASEGGDAFIHAFIALHNHAYKNAAIYLRKAAQCNIPIQATGLLSAQLAEASGYTEEALHHYRLLSQQQEATPAAYYALLKHALTKQTYEEAWTYVEKLIQLGQQEAIIACVAKAFLLHAATKERMQQLLITFPHIAEHMHSGEGNAFLMRYYLAEGRWFTARRLMHRSWKYHPTAAVLLAWMEQYQQESFTYKAKKLARLANYAFTTQQHYVVLAYAALQLNLTQDAGEYLSKAHQYPEENNFLTILDTCMELRLEPISEKAITMLEQVLDKTSKELS